MKPGKRAAKKILKRKNFILGIFILAAIIIAAGYITNKNSTGFKQVCINETCFNIEIADTMEERAKGLSNREFLAQDAGMLFVFEGETIPGFWMKDMNFPLDIIWIDSDMKISGIVKDFQPCQAESCLVVYPDEKIIYVLEINSGISDKNGFQSGDAVQLK